MNSIPGRRPDRAFADAWTRREAIADGARAVRDGRVAEFAAIAKRLRRFDDPEAYNLARYLTEVAAGRHVGADAALSRALCYHAILEETAPGSGLNTGIAALFCFPKSGSTYAANFLRLYTGYRFAPIGGTQSYTPDDIDMGMARRCLGSRGFIIHAHSIASADLLYTLRINRVRPVILIRDIFEAIDSFVDHMTRAPITIRSGTFRQRHGFFADSDEENRTAAVVYLSALYVRFFATWMRAHISLGYHIVNHSLLRSDEPLFFRMLLEGLGQPVDRARIDSTAATVREAASQNRAAFNLGPRGAARGIRNFTPAQRDLVRSQYAMFPDVDFSMIDQDLVDASGSEGFEAAMRNS